MAGAPSTFWSTLDPISYPFESNVDPAIARPWTQTTDRMLGTDAAHETQLYNGYQKYVAHLYPNRLEAGGGRL